MLQTGHIFKDTYRVEQLLGAGGMAEVYLVSHTRLPRQFALKLMHVNSDERSDFRDRFKREAEILAKLRHPHIVDVVDWDSTPEGKPYLVMEYLEGETLDAFIKRASPLSVPVALNICAQIGEALESAHKAGVIHRDLKPSNIFLDKHGNKPNFIKILDFGIAKITRVDKTPLTAQAAVMGTPGYMAPEQALGKGELIGPQTDQFALAAILYEMLTGQPAFFRPGDAIYAILNRVVNEMPEPLPNAQLNRAVMRGLAKKPEERFATLEEFLAAVGSTSHTVLGPAMGPPRSTIGHGESYSRLPTVRRKRYWAWLVGGAALAGLSLGALKLAHKPTAVVEPSQAFDLAGPSPVTELPDLKSESKPDAAAPAPDLRAANPASPSSQPAPVAKTTPKAPVTYVRTFTFSKLDRVQEQIIRFCVDKSLRPLNLGPTVIELERSGALSVIKAPEAVYSSDFAYCLRQAFSSILSKVPETVTIRVNVQRR